MKITNDNELCVTCELETDAGRSAFFMGRENHHHWQRSPETVELSNFVRDNNRFAQIICRVGDTYCRIK